MNVTIEVEVKTYDELSKATQVKLLNKEHESLVEMWQPDIVIDEFKEKAAAVGFLEVEVRYSGFGNQGDGACFDAKIDVSKVCKHLRIKYEDNTVHCAIITIEHRYIHERSRSISCEAHAAVSLEKLEEIQSKIEELRFDLCITLYRDLAQDYDACTSDEECLQFLRQRRFVNLDTLEVDIIEASNNARGATNCERIQII